MVFDFVGMKVVISRNVAGIVIGQSLMNSWDPELNGRKDYLLVIRYADPYNKDTARTVRMFAGTAFSRGTIEAADCSARKLINCYLSMLYPDKPPGASALKVPENSYGRRAGQPVSAA